MISIFKAGRFVCLWLSICGLFASSQATAGEAASVTAATTFKVVGLTVTGLWRTDPEWIDGYIDYQFPAALTSGDLREVERKLTTTALFSSVQVTLDPSKTEPGTFIMHVTVHERWTAIPVIRGAYGGGTPLRVFGIYDINLLGKLLTLGGESHQYGTAPPGFVLYGRNPRGNADRYYLGEELWREFRRRQVFDIHGKQVGGLNADMTMNRVRLLLPLGYGDGHKHVWKAGGDLEVVQEAPSSFLPLAGEPANLAPPAGINVQKSSRLGIKVLPTLLYDDIEVNHIEYDGWRSKIKAGPEFAQGEAYTLLEAENYYYRLIGADLNVAARFTIGQSTLDSLQSEYFLGGLDTLRGLPDGAIYGTHAAFANLELRDIFKRTEYLWLQSVAFVDAGEAGPSWREAGADRRVTAGFGMRFAVPQVYRLVLRIDYAWSVVGPYTHGVSLGLNQLFDPFIPL